MIITSSETKSKKYKQRQKRSNGLYPLNYLKADLANTPSLVPFLFVGMMAGLAGIDKIDKIR